VDHFGEIVSQLLEVHFAQFEIQIVGKETLHHRPHSFRIDSWFQEVQIDDVLTQPLHVTTDHVKERIDHLRLQFRIDPPDHPEVKERQMTAIHYEQIPRMRIRMKETVFEQLLEITANQ